MDGARQSRLVAGRRVVTPASLDPTHRLSECHPPALNSIRPWTHISLSQSPHKTTSTSSSVGFRPFIFSRLPAAPASGSSLQTPEFRHGHGSWNCCLSTSAKTAPRYGSILALSIPSSLIWTPVVLYSIGVMSLAARMAGAGLDHCQPPLPTGPSQKTTCRFGTCHSTDHIAAMPEPHTIVARSPRSLPHLQPPTTLHSRSDDGLGGTADERREMGRKERLRGQRLWNVPSKGHPGSWHQLFRSHKCKRGGISRTEDAPSTSLLHKASAENRSRTSHILRPASGTLKCRIPHRDPA